MSSDVLFYEALIASYVDSPRFVARRWLSNAVVNALGDPTCRFVLLTAEPGGGKTALAAWMARAYPTWLRYFIRKDQISPLGSPTARALLLQIGFQMAALHPGLFTPEGIKIRVEQRVTTAGRDSRIVAAEVQRLVASPFFQGALHICQEVEHLDGKLTGLKVHEWIAEPKLIPIDDLQYLALMDPAAARNPEPVVVMIDALDELRYHPSGSSLLSWLETCPALPDNVRFVLTARPDDDLLRVFRERRSAQIREIALRADEPEIRNELDRDLIAFAGQWIAQPEVARVLHDNGIVEEMHPAFIDSLVRRAEGNMGYAVAVGRALDQAIAQRDVARQTALVQLRDLPTSLQELYAYFLHQTKARVRDHSVDVEDSATRETSRASAWAAVYRPLLGALSVAREPLTAEQLHRLAHAGVELSDVIDAILELQQFLDVLDGRYRFHHTTLSEFVTASSTRTQPKTQDLFIQPEAAHGRAVRGYQHQVGGWSRADWTCLDAYGWRHLAVHAAGAAEDGSVLRELCKAGLLRAKRANCGGSAPLEEDWKRLFAVVRDPQHFLDFIEFGDDRSTGTIRSYVLQNGTAVRAALKIALRARNDHELHRIVSEVALISPIEARIQLDFAILAILGDHGDATAASLAVEVRERLKTSIAMRPSGNERDDWNARWAISKVTQDTHWDQAEEAIGRIATLPEKAALTCALAARAARQSSHELAARLLHELLDEIAGADFSEDFIADVLQLMMQEQRESPAETLHQMLMGVVTAAARIQATHAQGILERVCEQAVRITGLVTVGPASLFEVGRGIAQALQEMGLPENARDCACSLLARCGLSVHFEWMTRRPKPLTGWEILLKHCEPSGLEHLLSCAFLLPIIENPEVTSAWQKVVIAETTETTSLDEMFSALVAAWQLAESKEGREGVRVLLPHFRSLAQARPDLAPRFELCATVAATAACLEEWDTAREMVTWILDSVSSKTLSRAEYPGQGQAYMWSFRAQWAAACRLNDPALTRSTLNCIVETAATVLPLEWRANLNAQLFESLEHVRDFQLAQSIQHLLGEMSAHTLDKPRYFGVALTQFADAYTGLGRKETAGRCLREAAALSTTTSDPEMEANIACRSASLWIQIGCVEEAVSGWRQALHHLTKMGGHPHQAGVLEQIVATIACSAQSIEFKANAEQLLSQTSQVASGTKLNEMQTVGIVVEGYRQSSIPCPPALLRRLADAGLPASDSGQSRSEASGKITPDQVRERLRTASILDQAGADEDCRKIVERLGRALDPLPMGNENEKSDAVHIFKALTDYRAISAGLLSKNTELVKRTGYLALRISEPGCRSDACVAAAHIAAQSGDSAEAARLVKAAIDAWQSIEERLWAKPRIDGLFAALASIKDPAVRTDCIEAIETVLQRIDSLLERDRLRGKMVVAFRDEEIMCRKLCKSVFLPGGLDLILSAIRDRDLSGSIVDGLVFDILERSTRLVPLMFLGNSLLVCQIAARNAMVDINLVASALDVIERRMREVLGIAQSVTTKE